MNRYSLYLAAVLIVSAAASRADETITPPAAKPAQSSAAPADANAPSAAPAAKTEAKSAPDSDAQSSDSSAQTLDAPAAEPAAPEPAAPAPAAPATKPASKPEAKSEDKPAQAAVAPAPAPEKAPAAEEKPAEKPLNTCAAKLEPVVDSYQQAHDGLLAWLRTASEKMDAADAKVADLKKSIAENEAKITQLKLESSSTNETQARDLDRATKDLWSQLKAEESHRKDLCRALSSVAGQKVRDLNRSVLDQFDKASRAP